jgi:hypothetical protein
MPGPVVADPADHHSPTAVEHDQEQQVVIGQWRYLGTGWKTIADAARSRTPASLTTA